MRKSLENCDWKFIFDESSAHKKAENLQNFLLSQLDIFFPEKRITFSDDDREFFTPELKSLDRKRKRVYSRQGRSEKWKLLNKKFKDKISKAKKGHYKNSVTPTNGIRS